MVPPKRGNQTLNDEDRADTSISFVPSRTDTSVGGRSIRVQNPRGHRFEVITFQKADVTNHCPADKHVSWFPGLSWTVPTCPRCNTHLGWGFQWPGTITKSVW